MKLTINRVKLIKAIKEAAKVREADYKQKLTEHERAKKKALDDYIRSVEDHLNALKAGKFDPVYGPHPPNKPYMPNTPTKPDTYDDLIAQLELSEDEKLVVDDKTPYFVFISQAHGHHRR